MRVVELSLLSESQQDPIAESSNSAILILSPCPQSATNEVDRSLDEETLDNL